MEQGSSVGRRVQMQPGPRGQEFLQYQFDFKKVINSIAGITMKLIQWYTNEDGRFGLDRPDLCPLGFDFLRALEQ